MNFIHIVCQLDTETFFGSQGNQLSWQDCFLRVLVQNYLSSTGIWEVTGLGVTSLTSHQYNTNWLKTYVQFILSTMHPINSHMSLQSRISCIHHMVHVEEDTALILGPWVIYVFALGTIYFHSTCPWDIWLSHGQTWLAWAIHSGTPAKVHILGLL